MNTVWDPETIARAARIQLRARELAWGYRIGQHASKRVAKGIEFMDTKEYTPGDPIRDIDWRVAARSDRLVIRRQVAETDLKIFLVLDASADMTAPSDAGSDSPFDRAVVLLASLAILLQRRGNAIGLLVLGGDDSEPVYLPPKRSKTHLSLLMTTLASVEPSGRAQIADGLSFCAQHLNARSLCVVFSDLMEENSEWPSALNALAARHVDVRMAHVYSEKELELDFEQPIQFYSQEGLGQLPVDPEAVRLAFAEVCSAYKSELIQQFSSSRGLYVPCPIEYAPGEALIRILRGI